MPVGAKRYGFVLKSAFYLKFCHFRHKINFGTYDIVFPSLSSFIPYLQHNHPIYGNSYSMSENKTVEEDEIQDYLENKESQLENAKEHNGERTDQNTKKIFKEHQESTTNGMIENEKVLGRVLAQFYCEKLNNDGQNNEEAELDLEEDKMVWTPEGMQGFSVRGKKMFDKLNRKFGVSAEELMVGWLFPFFKQKFLFSSTIS